MLTEKDIEDLNTLFKKFGVKMNNLPSSAPGKTTTIKHSKSISKSKTSVNTPSSKKSIDSIPKARDFNNYKQFVFKRLQEIEAILNNKFT